MDTEHARQQGLKESLAKIRHHTASKIPNQRGPALLLKAVEATLRDADAGEQGGNAQGAMGDSPTAYFMALLAMLDKASSKESASSSASSSSSSPTSSLLFSAMYLLTLVMPFVSAGVIRAQQTKLVTPLASVLASTQHAAIGDAAESQAALLRSALGVLESVLLALSSDRATLGSDLPLRGCWNSTLRLCLDARPKVRRRAQDLVNNVLQSTFSDAAATTAEGKPHPYAVKTAEWATGALADVGTGSSSGSAAPAQGGKHGRKNQQSQTIPKFDVKTGQAKQPEKAAAARQKTIDSGSANSGIWICGFLRQLASVLPSKSIPALTANLLRVISQKNPFLSAAAFEVFESIFKAGKPANALQDDTLLSATDIHGLGKSKASKAVAHQQEALETTLNALLTSVKPQPSDAQIIPSYMRALENAMVAYSRIDDGKPAWQKAQQAWSAIVSLAFSSQSKASRDSTAVRVAGRDALCAIVRYCIPDAAIDETVKLAIASAAQASKSSNNTLSTIIDFFKEDAFDKQALRFSHAWPEILDVLTALVLRLRRRSQPSTAAQTRAPPAAAVLLLPLVKVVAQLRSQPKFEHRERADATIGAAVQVCGPAAVLDVLPLGLLGENGAEGGRAWLLPLMRSHIANTELNHFVKVLVPLSEALFNKQAEAEELNDQGKPRAPVQAKVYEALTEQIWALLPGYCDLPTDLTDALSPQFVELLANVLYSQPTLRASVCRALQVLVERSQSLSNSAAPKEVLQETFGLDVDQGKKYVAHLASLAPNLLAVFFNVFSQSPGESRGYLADCMTAYLTIMGQEEISKTYAKIADTLETALPQLLPPQQRETGPKSIPPIPHTMMDLLILLVPFLSQRDSDTLFALASSDSLLKCRDAGLQKKTYRTLVRLMEGGRGSKTLAVGPNQSGRLPELLEKLQSTSRSVASGAKRDRTALLAAIMPLIPSTELHFLPSIIPEAVLATKEVNQGARELAYRLLVEMGSKVEQGGVIKRHLMDSATSAEQATDEDADMQPEQKESNTVDANLNEYITMVAAGLAASSPHMVSATITALARLVYEFHDRLPESTLIEIVATMDVFLSSANREVVKSTLGFAKVCIVSLPASIVEANLQGLVEAIFSTNNVHRIHFKSKIRHIIERLVRRFGYERIEALTDEDNRKLLVNIRKRKERSKRKKDGAGEDGDMDVDDDEQTARASTAVGMGQRAMKNVGADAFEEAIYGSDSDLSDDSDDENDGNTDQRGKKVGQAKGGRKANQRQSAVDREYLMQDDDQPMDLLDRTAMAGGGRRTVAAAAGVRRPDGSRKRLPGQEASKFTLDQDTGRMLINDDENGDGYADEDTEHVDVDGEGRAYLDRQRGTHGFTTNKDGSVRVNKNTKRNRAADDAMDEEQMRLEDQLAALTAEHHQQQQAKKKVKQQRPTIGNEFRAKKAGGDIKQGETSPFAYVPLSKVGGKRGGSSRDSSRIQFLGKDKKRRS